ncbi:cellulose biosynthesis protein BcsD [Pseudoxanthomonas suwonensis]|uniref:cellulose biosynthesis protein BcsD n=1 Tax=Pseudoxanthomonas suwonensis TaxID=314722 RepID=UPI000465543A|nr:cellulose biosynthesis protein BcsD [Pseudoxanthomonas suwonensis]
MNLNNTLDYYRSQSCSPQWRGFLRALAEEVAQGLDEDDQARLMARIGRRFAQAHPLPKAATLQELQAHVDALWSSLDWGFAVFEEQPDQVVIRHVASPLAAVLGQTSLATGFLEGVYREWFRAAGMSARLDVSTGATESPDVATFLLCRVS